MTLFSLLRQLIVCWLLCGSLFGAYASTATNSDEKNVTKDNAPITVTIAGFGGNDVLAMNRLVKEVLAEDFRRANIHVSYFAVQSDYPKYILNALSSGNAPDAFYVDANAATPWIKTGKLATLSTSLQQQSHAILPSVMQIYQKNQQQYAIPKDINALGLVYNRDIFDDANVAYPNEQDTWHSFKHKLQQVVNNIGDEGVTGMCISEDFDRFTPFLLATGWKAFDADYRTVLDEKFERAFRFYVSLLQDGLAVMPADLGQRWGGGCFATERSAVTIEGGWLAGFLNDRSPNMLYGATLPPKDPQTGQRGNIIFTAGWAMSADSPHKHAVETVIALLTGEKAQRAVLASGLALPSLTTLNDVPYLSGGEPRHQLAKTIVQAAQVEQVMVAAYGPYGNNWIEPIKLALSAVMLKQKSIEQAIADAQQQYNHLHAGLQP